jgi:hypothetical protein
MFRGHPNLSCQNLTTGNVLLPAAEQVLQELEKEARASWEERAIYHATQVTNLVGEA